MEFNVAMRRLPVPLNSALCLVSVDLCKVANVFSVLLYCDFIIHQYSFTVSRCHVYLSVRLCLFLSLAQ